MMRAKQHSSKKKMKVFSGVAMSPGISIAPVYFFEEHGIMEVPLYHIDVSAVEGEIKRFEMAIEKAKKDLTEIVERVSKEIGKEEAMIFKAHLMLVTDPVFKTEVITHIIEKRLNVEAVLSETVERFTKIFATMDDAYVKEKAADIRDVGRRLLGELLLVGGETLRKFPEQFVAAAFDLSPTLTMRLDKEKLAGFISELGSPMSHAAILARSMELPAVAELIGIIQEINNGETVIIDGMEGKVIVRPTQEVLKEYRNLEEKYRSYKLKLTEIIDQPSQTRDGEKISLLANVSKLTDIKAATAYKADGVGLYRTELPFMAYDDFPTEEVQYQHYKEAVECMGKQPLCIRLLDIGGDKLLPYFSLPQQSNPSLGWRGLRIFFDYKDILKTQLAAIVRASHHGNVGVILPMVSSMEDIKMVKDVLGTMTENKIRLGAMIEVPSALFILDHIAQEVDFLTIGTNDLIQYLLAVDRSEGLVAHFYEPMHPAVLHAIKRVVEVGNQYGKPVTLCGEIAGDTKYTGLLLGLGLKSFSMPPQSIIFVKDAIRSSKLEECFAVASEALSLPTATDIKSFITTTYRGAKGY